MQVKFFGCDDIVDVTQEELLGASSLAVTVGDETTAGKNRMCAIKYQFNGDDRAFTMRKDDDFSNMMEKTYTDMDINSTPFHAKISQIENKQQTDGDEFF